MSKILVARQRDFGFVKVVGRGSFQNAGCLKKFYCHLLKEQVSRFILDLSACTYLDSTFLGTLLNLGIRLDEVGPRRLQVLNASARNLELFHNLGLDRLIDINGKYVLPPAEACLPRHLEEIACPAPTRAEAGPTILEAHETLMDFDPRNVPKFKDVVEYLREEIGAPVS